MFIFDTHVHSCLKWYEPVGSLLYQMDANSVSRALLVAIHGDFDSSYMFQCMKKYPDRFAVCVQVDMEDPNATDQIRRLRDAGAAGIRLLLDEPYMCGEPYALWEAADNAGLAVSCYANTKMCAAPSFIEVVEGHPNLKIVLEHFGGAARTHRYPKVELEHLDKLLNLAKYPNIYVKTPGFGEFYPRPDPLVEPPFTEPPAYTRKVYEAFGAKRLMWGSDFPNISSREGYANSLKYPMNNTPYYTDEDKEWVFGKTALSVWG